MPFFSRRTIAIVCVAIFSFYGFIGAVSFAVISIENRSIHQALKAKREEFNSLSKEEKAIFKAERFWEKYVGLAGTSERLFLSYLQRKFDLSHYIGAEGPPIDLHENPRTYPREVHYLARIAYPSKLVDISPESHFDDEPAMLINIYSANCDHLPLPESFWSTMRQAAKDGGYYATHVLLALAMLEDNNCLLTGGAEDIEQEAASKLIELAENSGTLADLKYEAVAFLLLRGRRDDVRQEWIDNIVEQQLPEGGWSLNGQDATVSYHSTLLAFWSLLEYSRPWVEHQPLIDRPDKEGL